MKILLVEDENSIREVEKAYLERLGYAVIEAVNGVEAWEKFQQAKYDLVVLDLNLPQMDGIEVCRNIREISNLPIIMVTARVEEIDEISGLNLGADDYLKKPFSPNILIARVKNLLKRIGENVIDIEDLHLDPNKMIVTQKGKEISLTTTQFNILYYLASHRGRVFTRDQIMDGAYNDSLPKDIYDRTIDAHIKAIRKLLQDDCKSPRYILTVIGKGYKFNEKN